MPATLDDALNTVLASILHSNTMTTLDRDAAMPLGQDLGDEFLRDTDYRPSRLPPITDADIVAHLTQGPQQPRPAITAWRGADMDAYYLDGQTWRHCQTGEIWEWKP